MPIRKSLSGDGRDELLEDVTGIYSQMQYLTHLKFAVFEKFTKYLNKISPNNWNKFYKIFHSVYPKNLKVNNFGDKLYKMSEIIILKLKQTYIQLIIQWRSNLPTNNQFNEIEFFKIKYMLA